MSVTNLATSMRKIACILLIPFFLIVSNTARAQNTNPYKSPVDSAAMLRAARKRVDSLSLLIPTTSDARVLLNLYMRRGLSEGLLNQPDSAINDYTKAIALNPKLPDAYMYRAVQYQRTRNYEPAIADDEKAIGLLRNNPKIINAQMRIAGLDASIGFMQFRLKNYGKALAADSASLSINPNNGFVYENMALIYSQLKNYKKAIENYDACIPLEQSRGDRVISNILGARGDANAGLKKNKEAINDYQAAIRLYPGNKFAIWNLGVAYSHNGDYELAATAFGKTIPFFAGDNRVLAELYTDKAQAEVSIQKNNAALHDDSIALTHNSGYGPAYWNMANAYAQNGDFELSADWYRQTLKYYPDLRDQAYLNDNIANEEFFLAHYDEVIQADTKAIELNSSVWSAHLNRGRAYLRQGKKEQAMDDFKKVLALDTTKKSYEYAFALFYTGNGDEAIRLMQSNIVSSNDPAVLTSHYYNLACLYALMNKPDEANIYLKKCVDGGYSKRYAQTDPDLENIRSTPEFMEMMNTN